MLSHFYILQLTSSRRKRIDSLSERQLRRIRKCRRGDIDALFREGSSAPLIDDSLLPNTLMEPIDSTSTPVDFNDNFKSNWSYNSDYASNTLSAQNDIFCDDSEAFTYHNEDSESNSNFLSGSDDIIFNKQILNKSEKLLSKNRQFDNYIDNSITI